MPAASARKTTGAIQLPDREWLTPNETARALGIARGTLFQRIASGRLPELIVSQRGDFTFIRRDSVQRALAAQG